MFWGVILESGKRYTQQVEAPFHLTMAALDVVNESKKSGKPVSVMVEHDKVEYVLCTLTHDKTFQKNLDLVFGEGEELTFFLNGDGTVHLTGYILPDEFDEDEFEDMSDEESEMSDVPDAVPVGDGKKRKQAANANAEPNKKAKQEVKAAASPQKAEPKAEDKKAANGVAKKGQQQPQQAKKDTPAKAKPVKPEPEDDDDSEDDDDDDLSSGDEEIKAKYEKLMKLGGKLDSTMESDEDDDDDDDDDDLDMDDLDDSDEDEESMNEKLKNSQKKMKESLGGAKDQKTPKGILKTPGSAKKPNQNQNQNQQGQKNQQQNQQKSPNQNQNQNQGKKQFTPKGQNQGGNQFQKKTPPNQFGGKKQFGKGNTPNSAPFNKARNNNNKFGNKGGKQFGSAKKF